jgi:hypothetical protein
LKQWPVQKGSMKISPLSIWLLGILSLIFITSTVCAFEGRIVVQTMQGGSGTPLLYTVGTNFLRVEITDATRPNPVTILDRHSGALTILFPHNRSFVRLKPAMENSSAASPGFPVMPAGIPPGVGPTNLPMLPALHAPPSGVSPGVDLQAQTPAIPAMPNMPGVGGMPAMPMMPMEKIQLTATGEKTNLLGFACEKFEIKQRGEVMEIWATDALLPFQNYVRNQPSRFGPRMIEEQWAGLLTAKQLFPLRAILHFENGPERFRFEVQSITPQKLTDEDLKLLQPPGGYFEIAPLPF